MARLERLVAGDKVFEILGPHTDRNYFSSHLPELHVQMFGTGTVQYQINEEYMFRGERAANLSGQVPINHEQIPDPGLADVNWVNVGAPITAASGLTVIVLAAFPEINFIRAIVTVKGDGYLTTATHWD